MLNKKKWEELDVLFKKSVSAQFSEEEEKNKETVLGMYKKAQLKSKRNKIASALTCCRRADNLYQKSNFNIRQKRYINMYRLPNIAYILYKLEDYNNAFNYIKKSISCLGEIEKEFEFINFAKIHQAHNIIRIFDKQKRYEEYFDWNFYIFKFFIFSEIHKGDNKINLSVDLIPQVAENLLTKQFNDVFLEFITKININLEIPYEKVLCFDPFIKRRNEIDQGKFEIFHYFISCLSSINNKIGNENESRVDKLLKANDDSDYLYIKILLYVYEIQMHRNLLKNNKDVALIKNIQNKIQITLNRIQKKEHLTSIKLKLFKNGILRSPHKTMDTNRLSLYSGEKLQLPKAVI